MKKDNNNKILKEVTEYLYKSYTAYHAVLNAKKILDENGYTRLYDFNKWNLEKDGKYYITKNSSAIIAFRIGDLENYSFKISGAHSDSPALKIKGGSLVDSLEGKRINIEKYGGGILYSFMDIPLKIAGRLLVKNNDKIETKIVESDFDVNIPSLCIHHNRNVNQGIELNIQNDMLPLIGECDNLYKLFTKEEVIDADLYCVPDIKPMFTGTKNEFLISPRIDNLTSAYSVIKGLINSNPKGVVVSCIFDNEEIGSGTKQGADSVFLVNTLKRINDSLGYKEEDFHKAISNGFSLSIDNGHAVHPAHPEKSDIDKKVYMNKGIVIKHHTNYSTDGVSSAITKMICNLKNIMYQDYYNRSDATCGGTIGLITSSNLEMNTCDIGLAQLAMHSAIETVGKDDIERMVELVETFYNANVVVNEEDGFTVNE